MSDTTETDACPHCGTESYGHDERDYWKCGTIRYEEKCVVRTDLCNEREARKAAESKLAEARERERVAILSFDEERQRALREGKRVLEARRERDEAITRRMETIMQCELYEQERNKAWELLASEKITRNHIIQRGNEMQKELAEALEQVKELIYIAERAIDLAEIDFENDKFGVVSELRDSLEKIKEGAK